MKVLSDKSDISSQVSSNQDPASQPSNLPMDFFFNLLLQAMTGLKLPSGNDASDQSATSEGEQQPSADMADQAIIQTADTAITPNPLLDQLNMAAVVANNQVMPVSTPSVTDAVTASSTVSTASDVNKTSVKAQTLSTSNIQMNSDINELDDSFDETHETLTVTDTDTQSVLQQNQTRVQAQDTSFVDKKVLNEKPAAQESSNPIPVLPELNKNDDQSSDDDTNKLTELLAGQQQAQKSSDQKPEKKKIDGIKAPINNANAANSTVSVKPMETSSAVSVSKVQDNTQSDVPKKYMDALTQLGSFINNQTAQHALKNEQSVASDLKSDQNNQLQRARENTFQPERDVSIELAQPSLDTLAKEGYNAKIKVYPPELGHVTAELKVAKNNAELVIMTETNHVKEIIEANIPKLRENFQQSDINLTTVDVQTSQTGQKEQQSQQNMRDGRELFRDAQRQYTESNGSEMSTKEPERRVIDSIIDTYA